MADPSEPLESSADVVVVGAGVVGLSIALALAERQLRVTVLEAGPIAGGTSDNSFAWINATSKASDEAYHRLNARGAAGYRRLAAEWGEARVGVHPTGMLEWSSPADTSRVEALRTRLEQLRAWGYPVSWVGTSDLEAMEPHVRFPAGAEGLHAIADAWLDVPTHAAFLAERLRAHGAAVHPHTPALELSLADDGTIAGVRCSRGEIAAARVVLAAGRWSPEVLAALTGFDAYATRFPLQRAAGLLVRTPPLAPFTFARHVLYTPEEGHFHLRPTADGGLLLGADDTDGLVEEGAPVARVREAARVLLARARRLVPRFPGEELLSECELKIGVRPVPADGHSIAGPLPGAEGLHLALTHSGVTLAPALAELVAASVETGRAPPALEPFGFERFQSPGR